eukprot:CAMPEP_0119039392 /NCGR_PEP_ID=MMETSP1177-20130426/8837_1 /TAXON_ID=2985 /ORGANISM="Ochromonas sp, Strain CCMP1899" /LENGTH=143 /DNA_ID=CAMNT_0007003185 /DNA_START=234 /DNA_END=662 /DNA_ORIENTATION=-
MREGEEVAYAEYEEELRKEEREEESFITPGETSEEDDLELQRRKSEYKKEREASAEHEFEYAEYEEELKREEREEASFITPGKTCGEESLGPPSRLFLDMLDVANEEYVAEEEELREEEREEESFLAHNTREEELHIMQFLNW